MMVLFQMVRYMIGVKIDSVKSKSKQRRRHNVSNSMHSGISNCRYATLIIWVMIEILFNIAAYLLTIITVLYIIITHWQLRYLDFYIEIHRFQSQMLLGFSNAGIALLLFYN